MQLNRCPVCHTRISLDALVMDEAGRELLGLLAKADAEFGTALVGYLSLFRSPSRDLDNGRAVRLVKELLDLGSSYALTVAMAETVSALRDKGLSKPLKNHNYLKRVLETTPESRDVTTAKDAINRVSMGGAESKSYQGLRLLQEMKQ